MAELPPLVRFLTSDQCPLLECVCVEAIMKPNGRIMVQPDEVEEAAKVLREACRSRELTPFSHEGLKL